MANLGRKYTCYSCHTKFYDLGKPEPLCPKCGADQRDAEETPLYVTGRSKRVVDDPPDEPEIDSDSERESGSGDDDEDEITPIEQEEDSDDDEDEDL